MLVTLNTSARNCTFQRFGKRVFFVSVVSIWLVLSLRQPLNVCGALPNVYAGGFENTLGSSQRSGVGSATQGFCPFQLGR